MFIHLRRSIVVSVFFLLLCGLIYPLIGTGFAQVLFQEQANGSLIENGSALIAQQWTGPKWFQGRPDGTLVTTAGDGVVVSAAANLGPRSKALEESVTKQAAILRKEGIVPTNDLVTTSGSLVDPDISPADAYTQVRAVAGARGLRVAMVRDLVASHTKGAQLGFLGMPYVDVLELNNALAKLR